MCAKQEPSRLKRAYFFRRFVLQKSRSSDFLRNKKPMQQAGATERALIDYSVAAY
jgi:hypothetical protein